MMRIHFVGLLVFSDFLIGKSKKQFNLCSLLNLLSCTVVFKIVFVVNTLSLFKCKNSSGQIQYHYI